MQDGKVTITDKQIMFDCFAEFVEAMLLSYAAVEALVNKRIESIDGSVKGQAGQCAWHRGRTGQG